MTKQTAMKLPVLPKRSQFSKKKSIFDNCICVSYLIRPRIASKIALTIACASIEEPASSRIFSIISKMGANMCGVLPSPLIRQLIVPYNQIITAYKFDCQKENGYFWIFFDTFRLYYKPFVNKIYKNNTSLFSICIFAARREQKYQG